MVKVLSFKGDKKSKKRKHRSEEDRQSSKLNDLGTTTTPAKAIDEDDDGWVTAEAVTDIVGPIIIALSSVPPTCIACDADGKVWPSPVENIIETEPHDIRQVWVASRVAGTEYFSFKGHHGRYLGCDKFGALSATREAVSTEESFLCIASPDVAGMFNIQTQRDLFLTVDGEAQAIEIRGDAEIISFKTTLRLRMQARYKPRIKANKESKAKEKVSRKELEDVVGRRLEDGEVKQLKKARREGNYHEAILDVRVKGKHDKFASL